MAQYVEALRYKTEGRGFGPTWFYWYFSLTLSFWPHSGSGVDSACNRNEYQEYFLLGWQPCHLHVPIVMKSGSLKHLEASGPAQACKGIALTFFICIRISHVICHFSGFVLIKMLSNNDAADILRILLRVRIYVFRHILYCIFHRQTVFCLHHPILIYDACHLVHSAFIFRFRTYKTHPTKKSLVSRISGFRWHVIWPSIFSNINQCILVFSPRRILLVLLDTLRSEGCNFPKRPSTTPKLLCLTSY
jgi:hypothetical protein